MSTPERPAATLPLPNALAHVVAVVAVIATLILPFALVAGGLNLTEAAEGYYLHSAVFFAVLGALIVRRRPGHTIGWLLVGIGGLDAVSHFANEYELSGLDERWGLPSAQVVTALTTWIWVPVVAMIGMALSQLLPDGRLLSPRWRLLAWFGTAATALLAILFGISPSTSGPAEELFDAAFALFGLATLASLVPLMLRYRSDAVGCRHGRDRRTRRAQAGRRDRAAVAAVRQASSVGDRPDTRIVTR